MDLLEPLPRSDNFIYLLTMIDRFAIPLKHIDTKTVLDSFLENWVSRYDVPEQLTTDRRSQFTPQTFSEVRKPRSQLLTLNQILYQYQVK